jgi:hypothetical protein
MFDKKNPYTGFGQMLISIGILNLIVRVNIIADFAVTFFFLAKGGSLIRDRKWPNDDRWNRSLAVSGMIWPVIKLFWIYFYMSERMVEASQDQLTKLSIITSSSIFLVPSAVIAFFAYKKIKTLKTGQ